LDHASEDIASSVPEDLEMIGIGKSTFSRALSRDRERAIGACSVSRPPGSDEKRVPRYECADWRHATGRRTGGRATHRPTL
jgi:hypothetical protein